MKFLSSHNGFDFASSALHTRSAGMALAALVLVLMLGLFGIDPSKAEDKTQTTPAETGSGSSAETAAPTRVIDFEKLETIDNKIYQQVTVRRIEPDSLLIEHNIGIARISLFDLPIEIQQRYEFDPDAAVEHYKQREAEQRALRKEMLLKRVEHQAAEEARTRQEILERTAKAQWIPVRAKIVAIKDGNALAHVDRIVMVPTRTKNVFGGEGLPGPPRKEYLRISSNPVWLKGIGEGDQQSKVRVGKFWTGYIWPDGEISLDAKRPEDTTSAYRALKPKK